MTLNHGYSAENPGRLIEDPDGFPSGERIRRVEEMAGNLIRFVANSQVKTINNEAKLLLLERSVYDLECRCREMHRQAAEREKRIAILEEAIKQTPNILSHPVK